MLGGSYEKPLTTMREYLDRTAALPEAIEPGAGRLTRLLAALGPKKIERLAGGIVGMGSPEWAVASVTAHLDAGADHVVVQVLGDGNPAGDPRPALRHLAKVLAPASA